jgi:hypothetical protein
MKELGVASASSMHATDDYRDGTVLTCMICLRPCSSLIPGTDTMGRGVMLDDKSCHS